MEGILIYISGKLGNHWEYEGAEICADITGLQRK
jgi:hypothetical protein